MAKFIRSLLYIILSVGIAHFTQVLFSYVTPSYMSLGWPWLILIFLFMSSILVGLISFLPRLLSALILRLRSFHKLESLLITIALVFYCFYTCKDAWGIAGEYSGRQIFAAVTLNLIAIQVFLAVFRSMVAFKEVQEEPKF